MSPFTPRLVATDLDGTIVRSDGTISVRTIAALARVENAGATLVFVTGRPPRWMRYVAETVAHHGLAICANGALVYDLHEERVVRSYLIDPPVLTEAVERMRAADADLYFAVEHETEFVYEARGRRFNEQASSFGGRPVDGETMVSRPGSKLIAFHYGVDGDTLADRARELVGDLLTVTHSSSSGMVEMSAYGVSKASALSELCADRGIVPGQVVAFGDMPNDLPMLAWAGESYAMANAHPEVLAAVERRAASNDEDGVAQGVERLFPAR
jgi:Cof subfamily protein (haloacid dehalogenase superfamily)